jgi:hypothetical protein
MFSYEELGGLESSESWLLGRTLASRVGVALYEIAMRHLGRVERCTFAKLAESYAGDDGIICPQLPEAVVTLCDVAGNKFVSEVAL